MNRGVLITVLVILIVVVGGLLGWYFTKEKPIGTNTNSNLVNAEVMIPPKNTVWIVDGNFTPAVVTVAVGERITWVNKDLYKRKIASDPHPTGTSLPDLISSELTKDGSFSFSFTNKGQWGYHDYLNPIKKGTIIVQ
jgi:plastocyanin